MTELSITAEQNIKKATKSTEQNQHQVVGQASLATHPTGQSPSPVK